jgi:hypothetical protein
MKQYHDQGARAQFFETACCIIVSFRGGGQTFCSQTKAPDCVNCIMPVAELKRKKKGDVKAADAKKPRPAKAKLPVNRRAVFISFSDVEDGAGSKTLSIIREIAEEAGVRAARAAKEMGLPKTYATRRAVIRLSADGKTREVISIPSEGRGSYYRKYKKGAVLHARKN